MENSELLSSQESLPLSQESFSYFWQECKKYDDGFYVNLLNDAELLMSESELCKLENTESNEMENLNNNNVIVPASTSSAANVGEYSNLSVPAKNVSTIPEENVKDEYFSENSVIPQQVNSSNIPPCTDWPGDYDFNISFNPQEKSTKSTSWIYSEIKEQLYVNMGVPCPVNVHTKAKPPFGSVIRAMPIFSRAEHITDVVKRCINHSNPTDKSNEGHAAPDHLIRCDNSFSQYMEDIVTKRQSVISPYENPQAGMEYTTYLYKFMCLGSCAGGTNRRPLKLIFTLENNGCCLGRKVLNLRICACPGRDKKTDEKKIEKQQLKTSSSHPKSSHDTISGPPSKKQKLDSGDEESHFTITVHRRSHYELLTRVKDALEITSLLTPEQLEQLAMLRQRRRDKKNRRLAQQSSGDSST